MDAAVSPETFIVHYCIDHFRHIDTDWWSVLWGALTHSMSGSLSQSEGHMFGGHNRMKQTMMPVRNKKKINELQNTFFPIRSEDVV